jgi:hypothetical protein
LNLFPPEERVRILVATVIFPALISLLFLSSPLHIFQVFIALFLPFALCASAFHAFCREKHYSRCWTYILGGVIIGLPASQLTFLLMGFYIGVNFYQAQNLMLLSIPLGAIFGGVFAYHFWAVVVNKRKRVIIASILAAILVLLLFPALASSFLFGGAD